MTVNSMTGFARSSGQLEGLSWQWEIRSVNGKALDVRCRLPVGYESLEPDIRSAAQQVLRRGNLQVSLTVTGKAVQDTIRLNPARLDQVVKAGEALRRRIGGKALRADLLLAVPGVFEVVPAEEDDNRREAVRDAMFSSFRDALRAVADARREEGARLSKLIGEHIERIAHLVDLARSHPSRRPEVIRQRLSEQLARLVGEAAALDPVRLHQEAMLLATRADIQEEVDRLTAHVEAARSLMRSGEAIGRKFDFLAQEFNREANTLCSKSADPGLTAIGLDLKIVIDQMREQLQNIE